MAMTTRLREYAALGIFMAAAYTIAALGGAATESALNDWYPGLRKSVLNPPNIAFPIAWTILFTLMGIAAWLVWRQREVQREAVRGALFVFFVQLLFNLGCSVAFFGMRSPLAGLIVVVPFWILLVELARRYHPISRPAFWMTVPYVLWVGFASYLNLVVFLLN